MSSVQPASLCHRCGMELIPGKGNFFVVNIEAFADPTPASIEDKAGPGDLRQEIEHIMGQLRGQSERELLDQVYRKLTILLCVTCYQHWIEDPAGET